MGVRCRPRCYPGRRQGQALGRRASAAERALAAWAGAAGSGLIAWGLGTEAPARAEVDKNIQQNRDLLARLGKLGPEASATAGTQTLRPAKNVAGPTSVTGARSGLTR
jgi:hypothetical protein